MEVITQTKGHFIINGSAISLDGNVVSYRADADVQVFKTKAAMMKAHQTQFPEQYEADDGDI
jgi:esterase/lipase superfamily enzyme